MMNTNSEIQANGVNERTTQRSQLTLGNGTVEDQAVRGRQPDTGTTRRKYTRADNRAVMECYFKSRPDVRGYRRRMHNIWMDSGGFDISEQRLADQVRIIRRDKWFREEELDEIKETIHEEERRSNDEEGNEGLDEQMSPVPPREIAQIEPGREHTMRIVREPTSATEKELVDRIIDGRSRLTRDRPRLRALRHIEREKIIKEVKQIDKVLDCVEINDITELNDTIMACAKIITEKFCRSGEQRQTRGDPAWKVRLQQKLEVIRSDLSKVVECRGRDYDDPMRTRLEKKYRIRNKGYDVVIEELKQDLSAVSQKIKRYTERVEQYNQNRTFVNNQKRFYQELQGKGTNISDEAPDKEESREFWQGIWSEPSKHNTNAEWVNRVKCRLEHVDRQEDLSITVDDVKKMIRRVPNWKSPGPDGVQGFWIKNFTSLHQLIQTHLQKCLDDGIVPKWMTSGRTALIMKDPAKGRQPGNYRPITCLPLMWKTLTGILADKLYEHLSDQDVIGDEQKGCIRNSRGTKDHLMLDKAILRDSRKRSTNLAICWIDYQKAYDLLPHSWILETMETTGMAKNVIELIRNSMRSWNTELEYLGEKIAEVDIKRGIFQGDSLSPLLFVTALVPLSILMREAVQGYKFRQGRKVNHLLYMDDLKLYGKSKAELEALVNTVRIFTSDIQMKFGLQKCATLVMKRGKKIEDEGISMPDGQLLQDLGEESYKYLGVLEADRIKMDEMKEKVRKEYYRRVRKVLESKLNGGNVIKAMNTWAVAAVRYTAGILDWTVNELKEMDRKTRKLMTMNRALHPKADVDRLYVSRNEGGRGMMSIEECVRIEECSLSDYVKKIETNDDSVLDSFIKDKTAVEFKKDSVAERTDGWKGKALHGQYPKKVEEMETQSWDWLRCGWLKKETEGMILAAQDQALPTRNYKVAVMKEQGSKKCRMCGERDETVMHILSECEKLAQGEYKKRHDRVASIIHWELCGIHGFQKSKNWFDHQAEPVLESDDVKILWDFNIHTDRVIEARRPDIVVVDKVNSETMIIDIAVPGDFRVKMKESEKIEKYQDLALELTRVWKTSTKVIPIVIGALGAKYRILDWMALLGVDMRRYTLIQQTALLGSANILRKVLSIPA